MGHDAMGAQARFWQELVESRRDCAYVELYLDRTEHIDRLINMFLAATSSTAIASWVVWDHIPEVWATLIAGSQVITALKPWIPYNARLKPLRTLSADCSALAILAENDWYAVSNGSLTEDEIQAKYVDLMTRRDKMKRAALGDIRLPENQRLSDQAGAATAAYFTRRYGV